MTHTKHKFNIQVTKEGMKTFGCLCCESGPLNLKVTLNKNGFVPGEYINVVAEVKTNDNEQVQIDCYNFLYA